MGHCRSLHRGKRPHWSDFQLNHTGEKLKYFIQRELNEYGPYTLADLQRYVAQGSILLTDLTRSEGMTEWVPVSQVIGNIPAPAATFRPVQPADLAAASGEEQFMAALALSMTASSAAYGGQHSIRSKRCTGAP